MLKISWLVLLSTMLFTGNHALAEMQNWKVAKVQGDAILSKPGFSPTRVELHDSFGAGQKITTAATGTVSLVRNSEAFIISPNSEIEIPSDENTNTFTLFFQTLGTVLFSVQKKNKHHFKVQTPFAAALVKGTTFAINVSTHDYQIQVFEGSVELKGHNRKNSHIVNAGTQSQVKYQISNKIKIKKVLNDPGNNPHVGNDIEKLAKTYREKIVIGTRGNKNLQRSANNSSATANNNAPGAANRQGKAKLRAGISQKATGDLKVSGNLAANEKGNANSPVDNKEVRGSENSNRSDKNNSSNSNAGGCNSNAGGGNSNGGGNSSSGNSSGGNSNGGNSNGGNSNGGNNGKHRNKNN